MRQSATRLLLVDCSAGCGRRVNQALVDSMQRKAAFCDSCLAGRGRKGHPHCGKCNRPGHNRQTCPVTLFAPAPAPVQEEAPMGRKLVSTTVYLRPDQLERMKLATARSHVPWAQYIRDAVDEYMRARPEVFAARTPGMDAAVRALLAERMQARGRK